jgi:hypothetical protein
VSHVIRTCLAWCTGIAARRQAQRTEIRLAALVAVDAPEASYLLHFGPAADAGLTLEDAQDVLVAVAPIVGTARTLSAASKIVDALGLVIETLVEGAVEGALDAEDEDAT